MKLSEAEPHIRAALQRLAESPRELGCYVIVKEPVTGRFIQFATPPLPSRFANSQRFACDEPLYCDGYGDGHTNGYVSLKLPCDADKGARWAIDNLGSFFPEEAELRIVEESTQRERPS